MPEMTLEELHKLIASHKEPDKQFYLDLLDADRQRAYEELHVRAVMTLLKTVYINKLKVKIARNREEIEKLRAEEEFSAESYRTVIGLNAEIKGWKEEIEGYKCFFTEPYFARMDLYDDKEGYNSYYIGKRGDINLEIVDWRAPLARKYYQKSQINFSINDYDYKLILRRALRTANGKLIDFKNEYLSLRDYLSKEEIAGRDEEIIFDPFLKEILKEKKEQSEISDIIETIQEKQYEIITKPERDSFVVQGCAGSGKTMILLHRLSFLMYNNEKLTPRDVLVITPSDSFNAFIDELSAVLELEKVKTYTIDEYFLQLLKNEGVDISAKINLSGMPPDYARYIYSERFMRDAEKKLGKIYDGIAGMFLSEECKDAAAGVAAALREQQEEFAYIRNASVRVRRCVLGEIKEKAEGGLYYTKPFRGLMNEVTAAEEFFSVTLASEKIANQGYFYERVLALYRAGTYITRTHARVTDGALSDLSVLKDMVEREIADLKRYKIHKNGVETETYAERIERRRELVAEIDKTAERIRRIASLFTGFVEFFEALKGNEYFAKIGKCGTHLELARLFYKDIVRSAKNRYRVGKGLFKSDAYALCLILSLMGRRLEPRFGMVFVDEGQDISQNEYELLRRVNPDAAFNVYGDLAQNITPQRGLRDWGALPGTVYELDRNYRNTNQIVRFVAETLGFSMLPVGFDGPPVQRISARGVGAFFRDKKGLKAVIVADKDLELYTRKSYNVLRATGRISKKKVNIMTVYESKGLEFTCVAVADEGMTKNEKYIAYTRALKELAVIGEKR